MKKNDIFKKTRLPDFKNSLTADFTAYNTDVIYENACQILQIEMAAMNDRGNTAVRKHMQQTILPGYACYKALIEEGISKDTAQKFISDLMSKSVQQMAGFCSKISRKRYAYGLFRILFCLGMKFGYPKEGWTVVCHENSKKRIRIDITSCLYCEELTKRNALELCPVFCQTDHTAYDPLTPGVLFIRKGTLAQQGNTLCDFCFENGKNKQSDKIT